MDGDIVTKGAFATLLGVSNARVSQFVSEKKISGAALVGSGHRARIRVSVAREQLKRTLDIDQRLSGNAKARLNGQKPAASVREASPAVAEASHAAPDAAEETLEDRIKLQRLAQLSLANATAGEEAAARSGRYVNAVDAKQEMGRVASRLMTVFESSLMEFANAIAANPPASSRDALRLLRTTWRDIRIRQAKATGAEAGALPPLVADKEPT